jgi:hypothetical protein
LHSLRKKLGYTSKNKLKRLEGKIKEVKKNRQIVPPVITGFDSEEIQNVGDRK